MFRLCAFLVLFVAISSAIGQQTDKVGPEPHPPTPAPNPNITTTVPTTTTTTTTTTAKPTTTTTLKPTTKTTPATTTSTTAKTTTSATTVVPPTTPKPGPVPHPSAGIWSVDYPGTNRTCLVVHLALQIEIPTIANKTLKINLPEHANSSGSCSKDVEQLTLVWDLGNRIILTFNKTNDKKFELEKFEAVLNVTLPGANASVYGFVNNKTKFATPLENSYKCNKEQTFDLESVKNVTKPAFLYLNDVQIQAFRNATGDKFDSAIDCDSATQHDVIPIVVGCVLAALVVLVLVGYLFGRRRCQARGYLSM